MAATPLFEFRTDTDATPGSRLVVGMANPGMIGLTVADYVVSNIETAELGEVTTRGLPDITPFSEGRPRYPMRLYGAPASDLTVLLGEVLLPTTAADPFVDALFGFADTHGIDEVTLLYGVPFPHGPDEHDVFYVATDGYRDRHLADGSIEPLRGGFFDGVAGELLCRGMEPAAPAVGAFVTPAHPPGPDFEGALRLLEAVEDLYGVSIDEAELRRRSEETRRYYQELAERMQAESDAPREYGEDRMYM